MIQKTTIIPSFILGTAGHIDHGKSRLVQQLTGTDPDRLAEEKRRGITIELGFAALQLPGGGLCGVVDVPGHERFVRHMVEGATGVDIALLVVAADDGVMVQTREHLSILELLGVRGLVVALNKIDLVEPDMVDLAALDVAELLQETTFAGAQIVPVSATTGAGLPNLLAAIEDAATHITRPTRGDCARLPIDRVFSTRGAGTVVTGTLWDGSIRVGDSLELIAAESVHSRISSGSSSTTSSKQVRVRDLQVHGTASPEARRGQRVALNLGGISRSQVKRGQMLCTPKSLVPCSHFYAYLQYTGMPQHPTPLKDRTQVLLHHGTREVTARVKLLAQVGEAATPIAPGDGGFVQLRADCALPLRCGDRFIIRNLSPAFTIGGGVVLLTCGRGRTKLSSEWFELLQLLQEKDNCETASKTAILHYVALQNAPQSCQQVAGTLGISKTVVARTLNQSDLARLKVAGETLYLGAAALVDVQTRSEEAVLAYHKQNPQSR
ncbi:MAG: selenocysteine-specific translation elongation factor, partial [Coriobacteriia bacterium]|nr:selenocysteine-specific translation elongation factor [Coriobacteriia bacterium]